MAPPRLVSVLPSDESGKHWVYFEDGRIALVDPKNASVFPSHSNSRRPRNRGEEARKGS